MNDTIERLAERLAITFNGGAWSTHYTERQKELWRARVRRILNGEDWRPS